MNTIFKVLAAFMAVFTLVTSAIAEPAKRNCRTEPHILSQGTTKITFEQYLPAFGGWVRTGLVYGPTCENYGMKETGDYFKPQPKKTEVKVLGGRPVIKNPEKHLGKSYDYCKDGRLHKISIVPNQVFDNSFSETCVLDTSKTLVLADLAPTALPAEPTVEEVKQEIIKNNLPPSDGMGDFCKDGSPWVAYAKALNNGKTYKISKYASTSKDPCVIGKASFRLELAEPHD